MRLLKKLLAIGALGGAFLPSSVPGLRLWLKADSGTFTDDGATTPAVSDGDVIAVWQDQSGNGYHVGQTDNTKRPLLKLGANGINSRPVILFDGTNDFLIRAINDWLIGDSGGHIFVVFSLHATPGAACTFIATSAEADATHVHTFRYITSTNRRLQVFQDNVSVDDGTLGNTTLAATTTYIASLSSNGSAWNIRLNAGNQTLSQTAGANTGDWFADTLSRVNLTIGVLKNSNGELAPMKGSIPEILVYGSELSGGNLANVESYLNNRFAAY